MEKKHLLILSGAPGIEVGNIADLLQKKLLWTHIDMRESLKESDFKADFYDGNKNGVKEISNLIVSLSHVNLESDPSLRTRLIISGFFNSYQVIHIPELIDNFGSPLFQYGLVSLYMSDDAKLEKRLELMSEEINEVALRENKSFRERSPIKNEYQIESSSTNEEVVLKIIEVLGDSLSYGASF